MKKKKKGEAAEEKAVSYLKDSGYEILDRNFYTRYGELDIIAKDGDTLVIIEVRSKSNKIFGLPEESITKKKIEKILKTTEVYLYEKKPDYTEIRFDIISILNNNISHIKNAFNMDNL